MISPVPQTVAAFEKPSCGGGGKPCGGGKGSASKPSSLAPTESEPLIWVIQSESSTDQQILTKPPTAKPAEKPEVADHDIDYVNLSTDSSEIVLITNSPTLQPTKTTDKTNSDPTSAPSTVDIFSKEDDYSCTGQPCQIETWCRSQYGSCGPGIVYCNSYSTWKDVCPPVAPGSWPTVTPAPKPTTGTAQAGQSAPSAEGLPPTLAKPTLPTITGASPANFASTTSAAQTSDGEDDDNTSEISVEEDEEKRPDPEQSYTGIDAWLDYTDRVNSSGTMCYVSIVDARSGMVILVVSLVLKTSL